MKWPNVSRTIYSYVANVFEKNDMRMYLFDIWFSCGKVDDKISKKLKFILKSSNIH